MQLIRSLLNIIVVLELIETEKTKVTNAFDTLFLEQILSLPASKLSNLYNICSSLISHKKNEVTFFKNQTNQECLRKLVWSIYLGKEFAREDLEKLNEEIFIQRKLKNYNCMYPEIIQPVIGKPEPCPAPEILNCFVDW